MMKGHLQIIRYVLLCVLTLTLLPIKAQGEVEVDWVTYAQDTVVPVFVHSIDLGYDYAQEYTAVIEYPELAPLTVSEVLRFRLPEESGLPEWPEIRTYTGVSAKRGQLDVSFVPIIWRDGQYWKIQAFSLKIYCDSRAPQRGESIAANRYAAHSMLAEGRWVKIRVADSGIHMLTHYNLKQMGFSEPNRVRVYGYGGQLLSEADPEQWTDDLCEVGVWRGEDRILFYAHGSVRWTLEEDNTFTHTRNPYSDYGYYFLTESDEVVPNVVPESVASPVTEEIIQTTPSYVLHEVDDYAWFHGGRQLVESYDYANGSAKSYPLDLHGYWPLENAVLDVCFTHNGYASSSVGVFVDEEHIGTLTVSAMGEHNEATAAMRSFAVDGTLLQKEMPRHVVELYHKRGTGVSGRLDYLRFNYTRFIDTNVPIYATSSGIHTYRISDAGVWDREDVAVWRITDASSIEPIAYDKATSTFTADGQRGDVFIAFATKGTYPVPEVVGEIANQDLHATPATDYIIIVPSSGKLTAQAERLAALHRAQSGLTVKVVRADEVYNEFSSGTPDATAYRRYLKMLYDRAATVEEAPKYLLLFGDGAWDNRMLSLAWRGKSPDDYLLCYEAENSFSAVDSYVVEDYFGFLDDGEGYNLKLDKVDIGVGRFPVVTVSQAREMVDKVLTYVNNAHAGAWKNTILMLGDDGDANRHMEDAESVARMLEVDYPDYIVKRVYWDAFPMEATSTGNSYPIVRKRLLELLRDGALMVNYSGHGAPDVISHELVINKSDMEELTSPRLPIWVTVSCDITPFDNSELSFGESAFLNPKGGAIGLLTSTRTTYAEQNRRMNYFFSKYTFARDAHGRRLSLGDAVRLAKCSLITTEDASLMDKSGNKLNYALIGDPALVVGGADYHMVVDKLNGVSVGRGEEVLLKAGSQVVVQGHVEALDRTLATDFSGLLYVSVFDNVEEVTCRNNANGKDRDGNPLVPFTYRERTKKFFVGSDSVTNGEFSFKFRVPMDINYSMESGLINLYAINANCRYEARGVSADFLLGETEEELDSDGFGPQIQLYLNSSSFVSGGKVNETPLLIAKLEDVDGINTAGGIGHSLTAIIDGKASLTYDLNEYYLSDIGNYGRGTVSYLLPELSEGSHTLLFRAWDVMNNSSTATLEFEVVKGLTPDILHVQAIPDLIQGTTTFAFTHDRPENEVEVTLEVLDLSGRVIWRHNEQVVSLDNTYNYTWNQCGSSGQPLGEGMYLYRVVVASPSGSSTGKAQKMVIIR